MTDTISVSSRSDCESSASSCSVCVCVCVCVHVHVHVCVCVYEEGDRMTRDTSLAHAHMQVMHSSVQVLTFGGWEYSRGS